MNTYTTLSKGSWMQLNERRAARAGMLLLLLLLTLPAAMQAQFSYTTNNGAITITGYTGPGGAVTIPDTITDLPVTSIGDSAFAECTSLTSVTIGKSVTNIGLTAFVACANLTAITVDPANTHYTDVAGVLFSNGQTTLVAYPGGKVGSYTIPDSVTSIAEIGRASCRERV